MILTILIYQLGTSQNNKENSKLKGSNLFIQNKGQIVDQNGMPNNTVLYLLNTSGLNVHLKKNGFSYDVYEKKKRNLSPEYKNRNKVRPILNNFNKQKDSVFEEIVFHRLDIDFLDSSDDLVIKEYGVSKSYTNYYNIPEHEEGITKVKSFKKIVYQNLYDGIDVEFFVPNDIKKPVEYNFIISPKADISKIKMKVSGAEVILENNALKMNLIHGDLKEIIPKSWIQNNQSKKEVAINYVQKSKGVFGFKVDDENYNKSSVLVIDPTPVREWGTYFGGTFTDTAQNKSITGDSQGNTIHAGYTTSSDNIATIGSHQSENYILDHWLHPATGVMMKFDPDGNLIWSTYYGGISTTEFYDIGTDKDDNIIGVGFTFSDTHISTSNSHQEFKGGENDGFLVKLNSNGERIWSSYYGGLGQDVITTVSTDNLNNIYIAGNTGSGDNMISENAFDKEYENNNSLYASEAFIAKFDQNGNREWGTYYGGANDDVISSIEIGNDSNLYIVGYTRSENNISTPGAYKESLTMNGPQTSDRLDTFIAKFNTNGNGIWGTYYGGDAIDWAYDLAVDSENNVIVSGATQSTVDIAFNNSHQVEKGGDIADWDNFLAKFSENGSLLWSSYYGGEQREDYTRSSVDTDDENNVYLAGGTDSQTNISTVNSYQENRLGQYTNAYLVKFDELGNRLWGTYYGSSHTTATGVYLDNNAIYLAGETNSLTGMATNGTHQTELNDGNGYDQVDYFVAKFTECESTILTEATEFLCSGEDILFNASGGVSYSWSGPNGFLSTEQNPIISNASITDSGIYTVYIESANGCEDTRTFEILVSERPIANLIDNIKACEDNYATGISSSFDTSNIESQVLGNQTGMVVNYFDSSGNTLPSPLLNPMTNSIANIETITVRVANDNNLDCYAETSFDLIVNSLPTINTFDDINACDNNYDGISEFDISNIETIISNNQSGMIIEFFHENGQQLPSPLPNTIQNIVINQETITARITNPNTNCYNESTFDLRVNPLPEVNQSPTIYGCDDNNDGISEYFYTSNIENQVLNGQTGMSVSYFDQSGNSLPNPLPNPYTNSNPFNELITVRITDNNTACYTETTLQLQTVTQPNINQPNNLYACDQGNGYAEFDTSLIEQELIGNQTGLMIQYFDSGNNPLPNPLPEVFQNTEPFSQTINVRVEDASNPICFFETSFDLIVNEFPDINLEDEYFICNLEPSISLNINSGFNSYNWFFENGTLISDTNSAEIKDEGNYTLTITKIKNGITCENSFEFALIRSVLPEILQVNFGELGNNYIEIIASGDGDFEYSIDGINYQNNNYFSNIQGGTYTVFVRDKDGCGQDSEEVNVIDYPKFFTPNNDGYNDFWQIKGIVNFPNSETLIFDRYGKLLARISSNDLGWNGLYNSNQMMSNDYWFRTDLGNGRTFSGHFSLKR
ncbi:T9SS type B sorting domain-containing protein [Algibacter sp. L4_22]|uniref:DUF7948 domain-containing protein n=1 Tax=Algibacter sp. L4_22 TaxID=2942477 RepID=UPI00201B91F0|nr:T9SS type B sorting domain-containing protein [Algibacter sp. L4_22]MCL5128921.1 T9SS type B sorting domain-containing protein [Algibacter sp. L4_22]